MSEEFERGKFQVRDLRIKEKFFMDDAYLNGYAKICGWKATLVYLSLCRHADKNQECFPSEELISKELGISRDSVMRGIRALVGSNIISIERKRNQRGKWFNNVYVLVDKKHWDPIHVVNSNMDANPAHVANSDMASQVANSVDPCRPQRKTHVAVSDTKDTHGKDSHKKETPSEEEIRLAGLLFDLIVKNNPTGRLGNLSEKERFEKTNGWAEDIGKLLRADKQDAGKIEAVIYFSQSDRFWKNNILSAKKLREKFDQLSLKMKSGKPFAGENALPRKYDDIPAALKA
jgi:AraC-like DNA-binding protein